MTCCGKQREQRLPVRERLRVGHRDGLVVVRALDRLDLVVAGRADQVGAAAGLRVAALLQLPGELEVLGVDRVAVAPHRGRVDLVGDDLLGAGRLGGRLTDHEVGVRLDGEVRVRPERREQHADLRVRRRHRVARGDRREPVLRERRLEAVHQLAAGHALAATAATTVVVIATASSGGHRDDDRRRDERRSPQLHDLCASSVPRCAGAHRTRRGAARPWRH